MTAPIIKYLFQSIHIIHARFSDIGSELNSAGLRLTWKTLKSQGICDKIPKVREKSRDFVV